MYLQPWGAHPLYTIYIIIIVYYYAYIIQHAPKNVLSPQDREPASIIYICIYITNNFALPGTRFSTNSVPAPSVHGAPAYHGRQSSFNTLRENRSCGAKATVVVYILYIPRPARSLGGRDRSFQENAAIIVA